MFTLARHTPPSLSKFISFLELQHGDLQYYKIIINGDINKLNNNKFIRVLFDTKNNFHSKFFFWNISIFYCKPFLEEENM